MSGALQRTLRLIHDVTVSSKQHWEQKKILAQSVWDALQQGNTLTIGLAIDSSGKRHLVLNADEAAKLRKLDHKIIISSQRPTAFSSVSPITFTKSQDIQKCLPARERAGYAVDGEVMFEILRLLQHLSFFPDEAKYYCMETPSDPIQVLALSVRHWQEDSKIRLGFQLSVGTLGRGPTETWNFQSHEYAALDTPHDDPCHLSTGDVLNGIETLREKLRSGRPTLLIVLEKDDRVTSLLAEAGIDTISSLADICRPIPPSSSSLSSGRGDSYIPSRDRRGDRYRPPRERASWSRDQDSRSSTSMKREPDNDFHPYADRRNGRRSLSPRRRSSAQSRGRSRSAVSKAEENDHELPPGQLHTLPVLLSLSEIYRLARNDMTASPGLSTIAGTSRIDTCKRHCSDLIYKLFTNLIKGPTSYQVVTNTAPPQVMSTLGDTPAPASVTAAASTNPISDEDDTEPQMPFPARAAASAPAIERPVYDALEDEDDYHHCSVRPAVSANFYENV